MKSRRIKYVIGDATEPHGTGLRLIVHCVSDNGMSYGKGFAHALALKYPQARTDYKTAFTMRRVVPGLCIVSKVSRDTWVVAMVGQHELGPTSLRHNWLGAALHHVAANAIQYNASVHMPRIGCGLAGGKWEDVEPLVLCAFNVPTAQSVPVTVYDLPETK